MAGPATNTIGGVECWELHGSGTTEYGEVKKGFRIFRCAWDDAPLLAAALKGEAVDAGGGGIIIRPQQFPDDPNLYCTFVRVAPFSADVRVSPRTDSEGMIKYEWARVEATYTPLLSGFGDDGDHLYAESYDFSAEFLTIPSQDLKWQTGSLGGNLDGVSLAKILPGMEYSYRRVLVPDPLPRGRYFAMLGTVNVAAFRDSAPETVLFLGARASSNYDAAQNRIWDVELKFAIRSRSWNQIYVPLANGWADIVDEDGSQVLLYDRANFNLLVS